MLGLLVFHKVLPEMDGGRFTVNRDEFNRIIEAVRSHADSLDPMDISRLPAVKSNPFFIPTFDDGTADHFHLMELQDDIKGVFFINTDTIGQKDFLDKEQIKALHKAGHRIGSHSHDHSLLTELPRERMRQDIERSVKILEDLTGEKVEWFAPPEGDYNDHVVGAAHEIGIKHFRTTDFGWNPRMSDDPIRVLNTFNIGKHFQSAQIKESLTQKSKYLKYYSAYRAKNAIKKIMPVTYRKIRRFIG